MKRESLYSLAPQSGLPELQGEWLALGTATVGVITAVDFAVAFDVTVEVAANVAVSALCAVEAIVGAGADVGVAGTLTTATLLAPELALTNLADTQAVLLFREICHHSLSALLPITVAVCPPFNRPTTS